MTHGHITTFHISKTLYAVNKRPKRKR